MKIQWCHPATSTLNCLMAEQLSWSGIKSSPVALLTWDSNHLQLEGHGCITSCTCILIKRRPFGSQICIQILEFVCRFVLGQTSSQALPQNLFTFFFFLFIYFNCQYQVTRCSETLAQAFYYGCRETVKSSFVCTAAGNYGSNGLLYLNLHVLSSAFHREIFYFLHLLIYPTA